MGHGAITYWKDGREVYDNVSCLYVFDDGVKMTFDSVISNQFYGLEEQIMGNLGTVEPEKGKYYFESIPPAPGFLQMINDWENKLFDTLPFAGTSWAPETANENKGELILGERPKSDGTSLLLEGFCRRLLLLANNPQESRKKDIMRVCSAYWVTKRYRKKKHYISLMNTKLII